MAAGPPVIPFVAMTDNELSPVAPLATAVLYVNEARLGHFRSQVPAMVTVQSVIVAWGGQRNCSCRIGLVKNPLHQPAPPGKDAGQGRSPDDSDLRFLGPVRAGERRQPPGIGTAIARPLQPAAPP